MYPLDKGLWGATTRITRLRAALSDRVELDLVAGRRSRRAESLLRYAASGRLRGLAGIYVENATTLPGPIDLAFLALARSRRIPILTYVRDAQQLFPEYYHGGSIKRALSRALFLPATRSLMAISGQVAFPSRGLALAILRDPKLAESAILLPPGSRLADAPPVDPAARAILFVGGLVYPAHGGDVLLEGVRLARESGHAVQLICVARPGEEPPGPLPAWLDLVRAEGPEIDRLLPRVLATITPRRASPYNHLAVPIKVLEYLGYGRPLIVTDVEETAAIVRTADCGVIVPDTAEGLAAGIAEVVSAPAGRIRSWGEAARHAAAANSWEVRADRILELLGVVA